MSTSCAFMLCTLWVQAQKQDSLFQRMDRLFIDDFENGKQLPVKLLHAEPLYIDLIRDLGARKGEREWNFGMGLTDNYIYDAYEALVEYEWAPINRLGFEIELPFSFYYNHSNGLHSDTLESKNPGSRLKSVKLATQWTFLVSPKAKTSIAIGYIHQFLMPSFRDFKKLTMLSGHKFEPFVVAAKRWGNNFHTLLYTGPVFEKANGGKDWNSGAQANFSLHYMLPGTRNFIGLESNAEWFHQDFDLTLRPQMRLGITDNLLIGIVAGIPIERENQRLSSFVRLIYEPAEHNRKRGLKHH